MKHVVKPVIYQKTTVIGQRRNRNCVFLNRLSDSDYSRFVGLPGSRIVSETPKRSMSLSRRHEGGTGRDRRVEGAQHATTDRRNKRHVTVYGLRDAAGIHRPSVGLPLRFGPRNPLLNGSRPQRQKRNTPSQRGIRPKFD